MFESELKIIIYFPCKITIIELQNMISSRARTLMYQLGYLIQLVHKKCLKPAINRAQNSTILVLITPPNRHIARPLAMIKRRKIMQAIYMQKRIVLSKSVCISEALPSI